MREIRKTENFLRNHWKFVNCVVQNSKPQQRPHIKRLSRNLF